MPSIIGARSIKNNQIASSRRSRESSILCYVAYAKYIAAFDGSKRVDISNVESGFDAVHHQDFHLISKDGKRFTRDEIKEMHLDHLAKGSKMTLVHFRPIGMDRIDVEVRLESKEQRKTMQIVYWLEDNKFAKAQIVNCLASIMKVTSEGEPGLVRKRSPQRTRLLGAIEKKMISGDRARLLVQHRSNHAHVVISSQNLRTTEELCQISMESSMLSRKVAQKLANGYSYRE